MYFYIVSYVLFKAGILNNILLTVYNYIVCILLYFFYLLFIGLYMIYLCSFCSARFLGVDIIQMLAYMRVCIYLWSCAVSIYYGRFVMTSCHIWQCPLSAQCPLYNRLVYMLYLCLWRFWCVFLCFFVAWWYPLPIFQRAYPA